MLPLLLEAAPALGVLFLPFLCGTLAALVCAGVHLVLKRGADLGSSAGVWAGGRVALHGPPVALGVAPEIVGSMDGYWPEQRFVGLSPRTWSDRTRAGRAIAAHELGHALAWREDPAGARARARGRRVQQHALAVAGAGVLTATLLNAPGAAHIAFFALAVGLVGHLATLVDEADASLRGARLLERSGERTPGTDLAMAAAFGVYLAPALAHLGVLLAWPVLTPFMLAGARPGGGNSDLALWAVILLTPLLVLRAMHVIAETVRAEPVTTEFRLNWTLAQERGWEVNAGTIIGLWLALAWDEPLAAGLAPWFLLALIPAMAPLGAIGRLVVVLPIYVGLGLAGVLKDPPRIGRDVPRPADPMGFIDPAPTGAARWTGLVRLAWVPLVALLFARALSGW